MEERAIAAGFGGQGVMLLGQLLARAMLMRGLNVTFILSYGAEVRGGFAFCHVCISSDEIYSPVVEDADTLIIMNQDALNRFGGSLKPDGMALVNTSLVELGAPPGPGTFLRIPATEMASDLGDVRAANMVMLGAYDRLRGLELKKQVPKCFEIFFPGAKAIFRELNARAIECGAEYFSKNFSSNSGRA